MYVVYMYWDYRKEFRVEILKVFKKLDSAIEYAESICISKEQDSGVEYACHQGEYFDRKRENSNYGRIAIDDADYIED
jgi:hypothetical protein